MGRDRWTRFSTHLLRLLVVAAIAALGVFPVAASPQAGAHHGHAVMAGEAVAHRHHGAAEVSADGTAEHDLTCEVLCLSVPAPALFIALDPPVTLSLDLAYPAVAATRTGRDPDPAAHPPKHDPV